MEPKLPYKPLLTVDELMAMPSEDRLFELSRGTLVEEPRPGARHGCIVARLSATLIAYADQTGCGTVLAGDPGFVLARDPDTVRGPDIAFVRHRQGVDPWSSVGWLEGPPDLVVEVLSPSDHESRVASKLRDYRDAGTPLIWLVQPKTQCITIIERDQQRDVGPGDRLDAPGCLPGFSVAVSSIFR